VALIQQGAESIIRLEVAIRGWLYGCHKGMDMVRDNAQVGRDGI